MPAGAGKPGLRRVLPWFYGWNIVGLGVLLQTVTFGIGFSCYPFMVTSWTAEFSISRADAQLGIMICTLVMGAISPPIGVFLDRFSIRAVTVAGGVLFAGGIYALSLATSLVQVILIYAIILSVSLVFAGPLATQTMTARWFRARRGLALGIVAVGTSLGAVVFPPIFAVLVEFQGSWRGALVILALFSAAILIPAAWLVVRNAPEDIGVAPEPDSAQTSKLAAQFEGRNWTLANVLRERTLWITVAGFLPINLMFAGLQNNIGLLAQDLSIAQQPASYLISMLGGAMIAGKLLFGALSDRVDHRILYWGAASLFGVCFLIMLSQPGYAMLMTACGLAGFGMGANLPLLGAIVASRFGPQAFGRVTGIVYLFVTASALGSYIASALRDASGSYDSTFQIFLIGLMPAAIAMAFLPRVKKSEG